MPGNIKWRYYNVHGVLAVKSNVPILTRYFIAQKLDKAPDLIIAFGDFVDERLGHDHLDRLRITYRAKGILRSEVLIEGLASGRTTRLLIASPAFRLLGRVSRKSRTITRAIIFLKMLQKWHAYLHAACVEQDGRGILLVAPPETGKTLTTLKLVLEHGFRFLSDDMTIIGPGCIALANPGAMTIHPIHLKACGIRLGCRENIEMSLRHFLRSIPYVLFGVKEFKVGFERLIDRERLAKRARVSMICFLEEGPTSVREMDKEEALRRILAAGRMHLSVYENSLIQRYAYQNPEFDLEGLLERFRRLCQELVEKTPCWHVKCRGKRFVDVITRKLWP